MEAGEGDGFSHRRDATGSCCVFGGGRSGDETRDASRGAEATPAEPVLNHPLLHASSYVPAYLPTLPPFPRPGTV